MNKDNFFDAAYRTQTGKMLYESGKEATHDLEPKPFGYPYPNLAAVDQFEEQPVAWLWPEVAPLGKLTLIAGEPGVGNRSSRWT